MTKIYFDNAATTPVYREVADEMHAILLGEFGNPSSIHAHGRKAKSIVESARKRVAKVLNASIGEIFFTGSATESNNTVIKNAVKFLGVKRIISSPTEHPCVLKSIEYVRMYEGADVEWLPVDTSGHVDLDVLTQKLSVSKEKTLVSLMHGNNEIGTMLDLDIVSKICTQHGAYFHSDTVQTAGKYPINLAETTVTFLSGSAHKFHGPKGVGFLYISNEVQIPPFLHGGAQERNMRAGTENVAGISGLATALEKSFENREGNYNHILALRHHFQKKLQTDFVDIRFNGAQDDHFMAHVLNVSFPPGPKADLLVHNLDIAGISCSSASACSSGIEEDSHVLRSIGHSPERKAIRFSFSPFNTLEEVDLTLQALQSLTPIR